MTPFKNLQNSELFYVRNHLPVPDIDPKDYELELDGLGVKKPVSFSLADLKKLPRTTITASIQCAGNRRSELNKVSLRQYESYRVMYKIRC
jgi:sulfite oxidase